MTENREEVRYCVAAVIDLLGFSSHLEVGGYDLRTTIGAEAIDRLENLAAAHHLLISEQERHPDYYPDGFRCVRINDALILGLDLPDFLTPSIGSTVKKGVSANELARYFDLNGYEDEAEFARDYEARLREEAADLIKFLGIVARLHGYVARKEGDALHPGPRTVVATGFRRPFGAGGELDFLSANFAFANAMVAEKSLHGAHLFVDTNVIRVSYPDPFARNILRYACLFASEVEFDPFEDYEDSHFPGTRVEPAPVHEVTLFRKKYHFRQMRGGALAYLHVLAPLREYLERKKEPGTDKSLWLAPLNSIRRGPASQTETGPFFIRNDIEDDITWFPDMVATGRSRAMDEAAAAMRQSWLTDLTRAEED